MKRSLTTSQTASAASSQPTPLVRILGDFELISVAVALPAEYAEGAVARLLGRRRVRDVSFHTPSQARGFGVELAPSDWLIAFPAAYRMEVLSVMPEVSLVFRERVRPADGVRCDGIALPRHTLSLYSGLVPDLQRALEDSLPLDERGLPQPWVPVTQPSEPLRQRRDDDDVILLGPGEVAAAPDDAEDEHPDEAAVAGPSRAEIHQDFERIRAHLALAPFPLSLRRGRRHRHGFVSGRVSLGPGWSAQRMVITTCPNADRAEILATLVHEFAHVAARGRAHGARFKELMVGLAGALWGEAYLAGARGALGGSYHDVDAWLAVGIRAALHGRRPPVALNPDEGDIAGGLRRIQKLRALASDQPGTAEGVAAAAKANDLIVTLGLGSYQVGLPVDVDDQLCDRWVPIPKGKRWQARVAFRLAEFCHVFALRSPSQGGMHLFGRYSDVVTAEYLCGVCVESIERRLKAHMETWRAARRGRIPRGAATRERTSFLHSAVDGLRERLIDEEAKVGGDASARRRAAVGAAEEFALVEHAKRGERWRSGGVATHTHNPAGFEAGRSVSLADGIEGASGPVKGLPGPRP